MNVETNVNSNFAWTLLDTSLSWTRIIYWHSTENTHWEESKEQNPIKIRWFFFLISRKMTFFGPFDPFYLKTVKDRKNLLTHYWKLSLREIQRKNPSKSDKKNFIYQGKWRFWPFDPFYLENGKRSKKSVDTSLKLLIRRDPPKKNHRNRMKNKNFTFQGKWHFWTLWPLLSRKW